MVRRLDLEAVPCPLCGTTPVVPRAWLGDVALGVPGRFALARCDTCGLWQQNPRVRVEQLDRAYPDDYPRHTGHPELPRLLRDAGPSVRWALATRLGYRHLDTSDANVAVRFRARCSMRRIIEHFPPWVGEGRLLDVGCATGKFLRLMTAVGWRVAGIEIDAAAAAKARAVSAEIFVGDPVDAPFTSSSFDVITSFHVLEHLPHPRAALTRMLSWLTPTGVMLIEVPNLGGVGGCLFGRYWSGLDFPRHLIHFTPVTMRAMVEAAGGRIIAERHRTKPRWLIRSLRHYLREARTPFAEIALRALDTRSGEGFVKLALEILLPAARLARLGEMVQYVIGRSESA